MVRIRLLDLTSQALKKEFEKIKVDRRGIEIMLPKAKFYTLKIEGLASVSANIIKQQMLASGGEAAVSRGAITAKTKISDCIIMGTYTQYKNLVGKLVLQPWGLKEIGEKIVRVLQHQETLRNVIRWGRNKKLDLGKKTLIMGILNVTPDSFSDGGRFFKLKDALVQAEKIEEEGADIIDIGGESTRPGAKYVSVDEELKRVIPVIRKIRKKIKIPISIDTRKSKVAREAIEYGADIINDVSSLRHDPEMIKVVKKYRVPLILMHMKGTPKTMQKRPFYKDVISEIYDFFEKNIQRLIREGIEENKIIIDPGIGFGKTLEHNIEIFRRLREFKSLGRPILVGPSRKSFIGMILGLPVNSRLYGTLASCVCATIKGADILRVHDVKEVRKVVKISERLLK